MNNWDNSNNNNNVNGDGWHFCDQNNANIGPVSRTQIIEMLRAGKLHQGSYVWKQGFGDNWKLKRHLRTHIKDEKFAEL